MLRTLLKKIPLIQALNARFKAFGTLRAYRRTCQHYASRPLAGDVPPLPHLSSARTAKPVNIFFVGTDEQQDQSGMLQALARLGNLRWFTRADGSYGQNDPRPEAVRRRANAERLLEIVDQAAREGYVPDILIAQTWSTLLDPSALASIRERYGTLIVNISMDDRHQYFGRRLGSSWGGTYGLLGHIDLALTAAPECVAWYQKEGCPALYFPEASDPAIFHPMPELPKLHDVSFVGARYGIREEIVMALRRAGVRVSAFGSGWEGGRLATNAVPALFAQSRIILGVGTIGHCRDFYALKLRDFDGPMSGSMYLTHANPDLTALFDCRHEIVTYDSIVDCVEKVRHYLLDEDSREAIAVAGRTKAMKEHTWHLRFCQLFEQLGLPGACAEGEAS